MLLLCEILVTNSRFSVNRFLVEIPDNIRQLVRLIRRKCSSDEFVEIWRDSLVLTTNVRASLQSLCSKVAVTFESPVYGTDVSDI